MQKQPIYYKKETEYYLRPYEKRYTKMNVE